MAISKEQASKSLSLGFSGRKLEWQENTVYKVVDFKEIKSEDGDYYAICLNENEDFAFSFHQLSTLINDYGKEVIGTEFQILKSSFTDKKGRVKQLTQIIIL